MPAFNGSGALRKKSKRSRIVKERESDTNFITGTVKSINCGKHVSVVLHETGESIECYMPKGIRVKYRVKDDVKINQFYELIGKKEMVKEQVECEEEVDDEQTVDMNEYNKEIKNKVNKQVPRNKNREVRQENNISDDEESDNSDESLSELSDNDTTTEKDDDFFD